MKLFLVVVALSVGCVANWASVAQSLYRLFPKDLSGSGAETSGVVLDSSSGQWEYHADDYCGTVSGSHLRGSFTACQRKCWGYVESGVGCAGTMWNPDNYYGDVGNQNVAGEGVCYAIKAGEPIGSCTGNALGHWGGWIRPEWSYHAKVYCGRISGSRFHGSFGECQKKCWDYVDSGEGCAGVMWNPDNYHGAVGNQNVAGEGVCYAITASESVGSCREGSGHWSGFSRPEWSYHPNEYCSTISGSYHRGTFPECKKKCWDYVESGVGCAGILWNPDGYTGDVGNQNTLVQGVCYAVKESESIGSCTGEAKNHWGAWVRPVAPQRGD